MHPASLILPLPPALGGDSLTSHSTGIAVIALLSMLLGYVLLFALWWFVFRRKAREKRGEHPPD